MTPTLTTANSWLVADGAPLFVFLGGASSAFVADTNDLVLSERATGREKRSTLSIRPTPIRIEAEAAGATPVPIRRPWARSTR